MPTRLEHETDWEDHWPSENIWKKFECDLQPLTSIEFWEEPDWAEVGLFAEEKLSRATIRQHDCMWAGHCQSKEHECRSKPPPQPPPPKKTVIVERTRSLLVKRPDTPQSSDEEAVAASQVTGQVRRSALHKFHDHNYDLKPIKADDLGVQTPSDSEEEEIDVVSVRGMPTNPGRTTRVDLLQEMCAASEAVSRRLRGTTGRRTTAVQEEEEEEEEYLPSRKRPRRSRKVQPSDSEAECTERRSLHNNMERMRRIDLRNAFDELRGLVPGLAGNARAPKVTILKDAAHYCHELSSKSRSLHSQVASLRREQDRLRANLSRLRRSLAATR